MNREMLKLAGMGVAMENSPAELVEVADEIARSVDKNGTAQVLEKLLKKGIIGR